MLEIYQHIINTCGYLVDEEGKVRKQINDDRSVPTTLTINDESRILVLPTKQNLTSENVHNYVIFHPFVENLARGESKVMSFIRKEFLRYYGTASMYLMNELVKISAGSLNHADLSTKQKEIIAKLGKMDAKFQETFNKIILGLAKHGGQRNTAFTLSLRKSFTIGGKQHSRVAVWSSPLADEIYKIAEESAKNKDYTPKIFGVAVRKSDLPTLKRVVEVFFPNSQDNQEFYGASDATDAPYLEAFVRSLATLPKRTNEIAEAFFSGRDAVYSKEIAKEELAATTVNIDWVSKDFEVKTWRKEYLLIPLQDGNEGIVAAERDSKLGAGVEKPKIHQFGEINEPLNGNMVASASQIAQESHTAKTYTSPLNPAQPPLAAHSTASNGYPQQQHVQQAAQSTNSLSKWLPNQPAQPAFQPMQYNPNNPFVNPVLNQQQLAQFNAYQQQQMQQQAAANLLYRPGMGRALQNPVNNFGRSNYQSPFAGGVNAQSYFRR